MAMAPTGSDWTDAENDLLVADYFAMLGDELAGRRYVKARHNAAIGEITGRTHGSIEFKHRNVSAVLSKLGLPHIRGYLPAFNAQFVALSAAIERYLLVRPEALQVDIAQASSESRLRSFRSAAYL